MAGCSEHGGGCCEQLDCENAGEEGHVPSADMHKSLLQAQATCIVSCFERIAAKSPDPQVLVTYSDVLANDKSVCGSSVEHAVNIAERAVVRCTAIDVFGRAMRPSTRAHQSEAKIDQLTVGEAMHALACRLNMKLRRKAEEGNSESSRALRRRDSMVESRYSEAPQLRAVTRERDEQTARLD